MQAIEGYRETEKTQWTDHNLALMDRLREATAAASTEGEGLETIHPMHVLDLAADGEIKPHIDSVKASHYSMGGSQDFMVN